jgi:multiple sugar transport system substrate-binding protein
MGLRTARYGPLGVLAMVVMLLAGVLTACGSGGGGGSSGPITIRFVWWGNADRAAATNAAVKAFEKQNPNITVMTEYSSYNAYFQKLATQVAGGDVPDLMQFDRATIIEYESRHALADLDSYVGSALRVSQIPSSLLAGGKVGGAQYAIPAGQTTQMLVYDTAAFARAGVTVPVGGWTWEQFATDMEKVGAGGVPGTTDFGWAIDWFEVWLHQHGKQLYTASGGLGFTAQDLTDFWSITAALRQHAGVSNPQATTKMDGSTQNSALVGKAAASEINYDSSLTGYLSSYSGTLAVAPLPGDGGASGMAAVPPVSYAVAQRSPHKDAVVKLLDFLVDDPGAGAILGATRGLPPNLSIRASVCASATAGNRAVCDYEKAVAARIGPSFGLWPVGSSAVKRDFQDVYDDVIFGRSSVAAGAARVVQDAQQSLGQ